MKGDALKLLRKAHKQVEEAVDALIVAAQEVDKHETLDEFNEIIRLTCKLEDFGCDVEKQIERMEESA